MLPFAPAPPLALPHHSPTTFRSPSIAILLLLLILLRHPSPLLARNVRNENECISDSDKYRSDSVASRDSLAHLCATFVQPLNDVSPVSLCMYTPFIHRELYIFRSLLLFFFLRREERFFFSKNYAYLTIDRGNYYRFNLIMIEFISIFFFFLLKLTPFDIRILFSQITNSRKLSELRNHSHLFFSKVWNHRCENIFRKLP